MKPDLALVIDLKKAMYIGPRGGKWADPQHTIPYDEKLHGQGKKVVVVDKTAKPAAPQAVSAEAPKKKITVIDKTTGKLAEKAPEELSPKLTIPAAPPVTVTALPEPAKVPEALKDEPHEDPVKLAQEIGEHVWGSRKDLMALRSADDLAQLTPENQAKVATKKNLMPEWDPDDLIDAGVAPGAILLRKAIESCIQSKAGDNLEARQAYLEGIDYVSRSLDDCKTTQDIWNFMTDWKALAQGKKLITVYSNSEFMDLTDEYLTAIGKPPKIPWKERKAWDDKIREASRKYYNEEITSNEMADIREQAKAAGYEMRMVSLNEPIEYKLKEMGLAIEYSEDSIRVYKRDPELEAAVKQGGLKANKYALMVAALGDRMAKAVSRSRLDGPVGEAPKAILDAHRINYLWDRKDVSEEDQYTQMMDQLGGKRKVKEKGPRFKWERNIPGEIKRKGGVPVDVANPQIFADTFKLKNVQFGEWVNEQDAESHLKGAHGALLDLADLLGVDPEFVSVKGRLSVGFGARGKGNAKAHYEPGGRIINLTKKAGGGSLAHEWAHALDHLVSFAAQATTKAMPTLSAGDMAGVSPKVADAMRDVMHAIRYKSVSPEFKALAVEGARLEARYRANKKLDYNEQKTLKAYFQVRGKLEKSDFLLDAQTFSQAADSYWTRPHEMFARAFESAIEDILQDAGRESSYLIAGTREQYATGRFRSDADYKAGKHAQMYPQGKERVTIKAAVQKLMAALREDKILEKAFRFILNLGRNN